MAEKGQLRVFKKVPAEELYRQMLTSLQATGHPWLTWKDPMNLRALNNNTGTIHMSNLCTEICLPQDRENIAVCNLASLNLATHVHNKQIDWENLEESIRFAIHQLDNLIDINVLPIAEATALGPGKPRDRSRRDGILRHARADRTFVRERARA